MQSKKRGIPIWFEICWAKCNNSPHPKITNDTNMLCSKCALKSLPVQFGSSEARLANSSASSCQNNSVFEDWEHPERPTKRGSSHFVQPILWKIVEFGRLNHGNTSVCVPIVKSVRQDIMSGFMLFPQMSVPGMCSGGKSSAGRAGHQCGPRPMLDANFPKQFSSKHRFQSTIPGQTMRQWETWGTS